MIARPYLSKLIRNHYEKLEIDPANIALSWSFSNAGVFSVTSNGLGLSISPAIGTGEWLSGGTPGDWEIRLTKNSGDSPTTGPALATWHNLGTTRTWGYDLTSTLGTLTGTFTVDFGLAGTSTALFTYTGLAITVSI